MGWNRTIALTLLAILGGLPLTGSICGLVCARAAESADRQAPHATHETPPAACHEPPVPEGQETVGASGHDCAVHDGAPGQDGEWIAWRRAVLDVPTATLAVAPRAFASFSPVSRRCHRELGPPGPTAFSPPLPLVLRV